MTTKGLETLHCCSTPRSCVFAAPRPRATIRGRKAVALAICARDIVLRGLAAMELQRASCWYGCSCSLMSLHKQQFAQPSNWIAPVAPLAQHCYQGPDAGSVQLTELAACNSMLVWPQAALVSYRPLARFASCGFGAAPGRGDRSREPPRTTRVPMQQEGELCSPRVWERGCGAIWRR